MQSNAQKPVRIRTGKKTGIWLALSFALALHAIILLLPVARHMPTVEALRAPIELQLSRFSPQLPALPVPQSEPEIPPPEARSDAAPELPKSVVEQAPEPQSIAAEPPSATASLVTRELKRDLDNMSEPEKRQLTDMILAQQFITEESAADQLFGKPLVQIDTGLNTDFHFPVRPDLLTMLDQPLPDMPFAYTPGLIYFAYEPGVKGDLQRFWDVITPEFGWRTKYGTEVRCILVLVIVGCGWK